MRRASMGVVLSALSVFAAPLSAQGARGLRAWRWSPRPLRTRARADGRRPARRPRGADAGSAGDGMGARRRPGAGGAGRAVRSPPRPGGATAGPTPRRGSRARPSRTTLSDVTATAGWCDPAIGARHSASSSITCMTSRRTSHRATLTENETGAPQGARSATRREGQMSRLLANRAFCSMNTRRGSTSSPISVWKTWSARTASSMPTFRSVRRSGSIVVYQS
jgi:hypothetical protein